MHGRGKKLNQSKTQKQSKDDDYYKPNRVGNLWDSNYIEYESNADKNKNLSLDEYLQKIRHYLRDLIIGHQESDTWKIQLKKAAEEERIMHSKSNNIKCISYNDTNKVVDKLFNSLSSRYKGNLETSVRKGINYPSKIDDWKTFEKSNSTIDLNILYIKVRERSPAYISKINPNCEK